MVHLFLPFLYGILYHPIWNLSPLIDPCPASFVSFVLINNIVYIILSLACFPSKDCNLCRVKGLGLFYSLLYFQPNTWKTHHKYLLSEFSTGICFAPLWVVPYHFTPCKTASFVDTNFYSYFSSLMHFIKNKTCLKLSTFHSRILSKSYWSF